MTERKSYKKKSIVAGSPAVQEHEAMMEQVMNNGLSLTTTEDHNSQPLQRQQPVGVFRSQQYEPMKNVQTRVPLSVYEHLNRMKYFAGQRTSIGDIVAQAINEYVANHPV